MDLNQEVLVSLYLADQQEVARARSELEITVVDMQIDIPKLEKKWAEREPEAGQFNGEPET